MTFINKENIGAVIVSGFTAVLKKKWDRQIYGQNLATWHLLGCNPSLKEGWLKDDKTQENVCLGVPIYNKRDFSIILLVIIKIWGNVSNLQTIKYFTLQLGSYILSGANCTAPSSKKDFYGLNIPPVIEYISNCCFNTEGDQNVLFKGFRLYIIKASKSLLPQ